MLVGAIVVGALLVAWLGYELLDAPEGVEDPDLGFIRTGPSPLDRWRLALRRRIVKLSKVN